MHFREGAHDWAVLVMSSKIFPNCLIALVLFILHKVSAPTVSNLVFNTQSTTTVVSGQIAPSFHTSSKQIFCTSRRWLVSFPQMKHSNYWVLTPFVDITVMYKSLRASKSNYVKRLCLVVPLVSRS